MRYNVTVYHRWDGNPCHDQAEYLPTVEIDGFTVAAARTAAASLGYTVSESDEDEADPIYGATVDVKPTRPGSCCSWLWFWEV